MSKFNTTQRKQIQEIVLKYKDKTIKKDVPIEEKDIVNIVKEKLGFDISIAYVNYLKHNPIKKYLTD